MLSIHLSAGIVWGPVSKVLMKTFGRSCLNVQKKKPKTNCGVEKIAWIHTSIPPFHSAPEKSLLFLSLKYQESWQIEVVLKIKKEKNVLKQLWSLGTSISVSTECKCEAGNPGSTSQTETCQGFWSDRVLVLSVVLFNTEDSPTWYYCSQQPPQVTWNSGKNILVFVKKLRCVLSSFDFLFCGVWSICRNFPYRNLLKASMCPNLLSNSWEESCLDCTTSVIHTTQISLMLEHFIFIVHVTLLLITICSHVPSCFVRWIFSRQELIPVGCCLPYLWFMRLHVIFKMLSLLRPLVVAQSHYLIQITGNGSNNWAAVWLYCASLTEFSSCTLWSELGQ